MITFPFPQDFYVTVDPPNKKDLLKVCDNGKLNKNQVFSWKGWCAVKCERLVVDEILPVLGPSIDEFMKRVSLGLHTSFKNDLYIDDVWRNTYTKGCSQEVHDHLLCDISGVIFLDDYRQGSSEFYFFNRNYPDLSTGWRKIIGINSNHNPQITAKRGQIIFFPSHMLHGVTPHNNSKPRKTVSFNINIVP
tara:strand:+ start:84 stop:656 length:573 start_codon:yes stop_codon:yes gene_type:complete